VKRSEGLSERILTEKVKSYKKKNGRRRKKIPIGQREDFSKRGADRKNRALTRDRVEEGGRWPRAAIKSRGRGGKKDELDGR